MYSLNIYIVLTSKYQYYLNIRFYSCMEINFTNLELIEWEIELDILELLTINLLILWWIE